MFQAKPGVLCTNVQPGVLTVDIADHKAEVAGSTAVKGHTPGVAIENVAS